MYMYRMHIGFNTTSCLRACFNFYIRLHWLILCYEGGLPRLTSNGIMMYHIPLQTQQKEVFQHGEGKESRKYGCSPPLNEENNPKRVRMHHFRH